MLIVTRVEHTNEQTDIRVEVTHFVWGEDHRGSNPRYPTPPGSAGSPLQTRYLISRPVVVDGNLSGRSETESRKSHNLE